MPPLLKLYFPFTIALIAIFGLSGLFLGIIYLTWLLFLPGIGLSVCNLIATKDNRTGTRTFDIVVLVMACVSAIPCVGMFTVWIGLGFAIVNLLKIMKFNRSLVA